MKINKILGIKGIFKGNSDNKYQYYQILAEDVKGEEYLMVVGTRINYQTACEKTFRRLVLVPPPEAEETSTTINKEIENKGEVKE